MRTCPCSTIYNLEVMWFSPVMIAFCRHFCFFNAPAIRTFWSEFRALKRGMLLKTWVLAMTRIDSSSCSPMVCIRSLRARLSAVTSDVVRTVAVRGMSYNAAISPKKAPFVNWPTQMPRPLTVLITSHVPRSMMYNLSPISPSTMILCPELNVHGRNLPTNRSCSCSDSTLRDNNGTFPKNCPRNSWRMLATMSVMCVLVLSMCVARTMCRCASVSIVAFSCPSVRRPRMGLGVFGGEGCKAP
mmetsp:Transcript_81009/g.203934  ORF Transcript_81009/g.203934 Transcript_81009/m.203934 type:complete len:243 (+) Transcript_81009:1607-2335(+)